MISIAYWIFDKAQDPKALDNSTTQTLALWKVPTQTLEATRWQKCYLLHYKTAST